jgi:hypothetical protein
MRRVLSHFVVQVPIDQLETLALQDPRSCDTLDLGAREALAAERFGGRWQQRRGGHMVP